MKALKLKVLIYYFYFTHDEYLTEDRNGAKYVKQFVNRGQLTERIFQNTAVQIKANL